MRRRRALLIITVFCVVMVAFSGCLVLVTALSRREKSGHATSLEDLERQNAPPFFAKRLPPMASDIWYHCYPASGSFDASFSLDESDFLAWVASQGWQLRKATPHSSFGTSVYERGAWVSVSIGDGYFYSSDPDGEGEHVSVAYDRGVRRCYVWFAL